MTSRISTKGLVAAYNMTLTQDGELYDLAPGHSNNGTLVNAPTIVQDGSGGQAMEFDGSNQYVNCGAGPVMQGTDDFTVVIRVKHSDSGAYVLFGTKNSTATAETGFIVYSPDGVNQAAMIADGSTRYYRPASNVGNDNTWHTQVYVFDRDNELLIYKDGSPLSHSKAEGPMTAVSGSASGDGNLTIGIGAHGTGIGFLDGSVSNFLLYNRALSPNEVKSATAALMGGRS